MDQNDDGASQTYTATARALHWITALGVLVMLPLGLTMSYRGQVLNLWDGTTEALYSTHKLLGFLLLWLVAGRLVYRLVHGAPPDEPGLAPLQRWGAHLVHWLLYGLLIVVPLLGWIGVSLFPALEVFGLFSLPALAAPDEAAAGRVLGLHGKLALATGALAALHIVAALYHRFIRRDGVLRRMWPGRG
ncbi:MULTISPECIES: cytochrome b [unclassified Bosea (in: a-proteobacteria)]|uniref:cytochrome b n=1 Tax=unclassified Bosea (in: a-proteobacteria) TaxID=2653178 RepID=UPI000953ACE6|nr:MULTISPECIES: cytochrome b [unclassified Bosea (in: a-proteobacteria)]TAJ28515.1 MAG: cytochrome b [Bosea sp. (in: a-proteobacteria)]SIQ35032.1 cytochrome b561 [Bosea sp. TND4EK4]